MVDYRLCQFCHLKPRSFQSSWNRLNCPEKTSEFQKPKRRRRTIGGERALLIPRVTWTRRNSLSIKSSLVATRRQHRVIPVVQARLPPCVDGSHVWSPDPAFARQWHATELASVLATFGVSVRLQKSNSLPPGQAKASQRGKHESKTATMAGCLIGSHRDEPGQTRWKASLKTALSQFANIPMKYFLRILVKYSLRHDQVWYFDI